MGGGEILKFQRAITIDLPVTSIKSVGGPGNVGAGAAGAR
jgi:hypothetical protein